MNYKYLFLITILLSPTVIFAQYTPLVGIPGIDPSSDFGAYINALYKLSIALAALLAVIKIIVAGVKWMLTDLISGKEDARKDIEGALLGLLIIIAAVVILETINPNLTKTTVFIAPAGEIDNSATNESYRATGCTVGDQGIWNNTSYSCDNPSLVPNIPKREMACDLISGSEYDCSKAQQECTQKGGVPAPYTSVKTGQPLSFKITCTPKSDI